MDERVDSEFFDELFALRDALASIWRHDEPAPPDVIYHYTSAAAAAAIIKSQILWATISSSLNDEKEITHGSDLLSTLLKERASAAATPEERLLFSRELTDFDYTRDDIVHVFAASLSAHEDDRAQWQLYADGGYGVALGFKGAALSTMVEARRDDAPFGLGRVIYAEPQQRQFLAALIAEWFARSARALRKSRTALRNPTYFLAGLFGYLATCSFEYFPMLKDPHFSSEAEWRMAHAHDPASTTCCVVKHRGVDSTAYVELPLATAGTHMPLVSLWLGPGIATEESRKQARKFLDNLGYEDVSVKLSQVPLRLPKRMIAF